MESEWFLGQNPWKGSSLQDPPEIASVWSWRCQYFNHICLTYHSHTRSHLNGPKDFTLTWPTHCALTGSSVRYMQRLGTPASFSLPGWDFHIFQTHHTCLPSLLSTAMCISTLEASWKQGQFLTHCRIPCTWNSLIQSTEGPHCSRAVLSNGDRSGDLILVV